MVIWPAVMAVVGGVPTLYGLVSLGVPSDGTSGSFVGLAVLTFWLLVGAAIEVVTHPY